MLSNKRGSQPAERPLETDEDLRKIRSAYWSTRTSNRDLEFRRMDLTHGNAPRVIKVPLQHICHQKMLLARKKWFKRREEERRQGDLALTARGRAVDRLVDEPSSLPPVRVKG